MLMSGIGKATNQQIAGRRAALAGIIADRQAAHESTEPHALLDAMLKEWPTYSRKECYEDRNHIAQENPFIRNMALYNYSETIEGMFKAIERTEQAAFKDFEHISGFVRVNSKNIVLKAQEIKEKMLSGKVLDMSVSLLAKEMRRLKEENKVLKIEANNNNTPKLLMKSDIIDV